MVRAFLDLSIEENFTVEYKRNADGLPEAVAAMANTHGGLVLVGIEPHPEFKNRPGAVVGVPPQEKERQVNRIAGLLDPAWWCPEVVPVPTGDGDKVILVVRIDAASAPRPVFHNGTVHVRIDGRNQRADRRLVRALFDEQGPFPLPSYQAPMRWPDQYKDIRYRIDEPPDLTVRTICSRQIRIVAGRPRLGSRVLGTVRSTLSHSAVPRHHLLVPELRNLFVHGFRHIEGREPTYFWEVDDQHLNSRFFRLAAGRGVKDEKGGYNRIECCVEIKGEGPVVALETCLDLFYWRLPSGRWSPRVLHEAGSVLAQVLAEQVLPTATDSLIGKATLPVPPIEFHIGGKIEPDTNNYARLDHVVALEELGERVGHQVVHRGGEWLREGLVAEGRWDDAVADAIEVIAMDWQILDPVVRPAEDYR